MGVYVACYRPDSMGDDAAFNAGGPTPATSPATALPGSKSVGAMLPGSKSKSVTFALPESKPSASDGARKISPIMAGSKSSSVFTLSPSTALPGSIGATAQELTPPQTRPATVEPANGR